MRELNLEEVQKYSLDLLCEFDEICKKYKIDYFICGGTLLGAVRHQGFIPWDDDTDVMMLRSDYERLLQMADSIKLKKERRIIYSKNHTFARHYMRYARTDFIKHEEGFEEDDCPWIGLDVFPIDFVKDDRSFEKQVKKIRFLRSMLLIGVTKKNLSKSAITRTVKGMLRPLIKAYGIYNIVKLIDAEATKYSNLNTGFVAGLCGMYGVKERWKYSDYKSKTELSFAGHMFCAPANYDIYLSNLYGDYMQLPPEDKRKYTHAKVYEK